MSTEGLKNKYIIQKANGAKVHPFAEYFVLRLDVYQRDAKHRQACCRALQTYVDELRPFSADTDYYDKLIEDIDDKLKNEWDEKRKLVQLNSCIWTYAGDDKNRALAFYDTTCSHKRGPIDYLGLSINAEKYKFCPRCGKPIIYENSHP